MRVKRVLGWTRSARPAGKRSFLAGSLLVKSRVSVEKVPQLMLVAVQRSGYKQARVPDAAVHRYIRRPAAHDGAAIPLGVAVLLLSPRRSGSGESSATPDRSPRQLRLC